MTTIECNDVECNFNIGGKVCIAPKIVITLDETDTGDPFYRCETARYGDR